MTTPNYWPSLPLIPVPLRTAIEQGECVPFVGVGASVAAGLPTFERLIVPLARDVAGEARIETFRTASGYDLPGLAGICEELLGRINLVTRIRKQLVGIRHEPTDIHRLLARLKTNLYVTTNWDTLLEDAIQQVRRTSPDVIVRDDDVRLFRDNVPTVVKLHGDVNHLPELVVTRKDYEARVNRDRIIDNQLTVWLASKSFLFVGYRLQDDDFQYIQRRVLDRLDRGGPVHYAVLFDDDRPADRVGNDNVQVLHIHV